MEQKKWELMLDDIVEKIKEQRIVPIVGPEVFYVLYNNKKISVHEWIVQELLDKKREFANVAPEQITEENIKLCLQPGIKGIHYLSRLFASVGLTLSNQLYKFLVIEKHSAEIRLNDNVQKFLDYGEFPLVITTNYYQSLDHIITYNGIEYRSVSYKCEKNRNQDVELSPIDSSLHAPTIYHIFGSVKPSTKCVLTEDDFLMYIHCIQDTNSCPQMLRQYLRDKYVLTIGCNIPDWTFRMLLYSLKEREGRMNIEVGNRDTFIGGAVNSIMDNEFVSFLERIRYYSDNNIYDFLDDINQRLPHKDKPSLFLSVCSEDYKEIGQELHKKLSSKFKVWYCEENLTGQGGEEYWRRIKEGLEECRYFLPVITPAASMKLLRAQNMKEPMPDKEAGIITEWKYAYNIMGRKFSETGEKYCFPYIYKVNREDFKSDLIRQFDGLLFPLFFNENGNQCIENINPTEFNVEMLSL